MERRFFWKLNIIDIILIGIVVLSLSALVYKIASGSGDKRSYEFIYVCEEAPAELLYSLRGGDLCIDGDIKNEVGILQEASVEDIAEKAGKARATIRVQAEGAEEEYGVNVEDALYLKGQKLNLIIGDAVFEVYISDIK